MIWGILILLFVVFGLVLYDMEKQLNEYSKKHPEEKKD